jgi:hypothetical protein
MSLTRTSEAQLPFAAGRSAGYLYYPYDPVPGVTLRFTPGFMLSAAPRTLLTSALYQ